MKGLTGEMQKEIDKLVKECKRKDEIDERIKKICIANNDGIPFVSIKFHEECNPIVKEKIKEEVKEILALLRYDALSMNLVKSEWKHRCYTKTEEQDEDRGDKHTDSM